MSKNKHQHEKTTDPVEETAAEVETQTSLEQTEVTAAPQEKHAEEVVEKEKPVTAEEAKVVKNSFMEFVARIKESGTEGEKMVVENMEIYLSVMDGTRLLTIDDITREQQRLYSLIKNVGRREKDFRKTVVALRAYFKEYHNSVFHDKRINRGHENLRISADERKAFFNYLQLFKIFAEVNDLKDVKKSVDVSRSLTNPAIPAEVKDRYVSLVN